MENKTVLTKIIEEFELLHFKAENFKDKIFLDGVLAVIKPYLPIERTQIEDAVTYGNRQEFYDGTETLGEQYYSQTFERKNN